jgi:hypothetical protein
MLATGKREQRLGDLTARTGIAKAAPIRHRGLTAAAVASALVLVLAGSVVYVAASDENEGAKIAASDGGGGAKTYRGHGVSFDYPAGWEELPQFRAGGNEQWSAAVAGADLDLVVVTAYAPYGPVTAENLDAAKSAFEGVVQQLAEQAGGTVLAGPEEITVAGKRGLWFRMTGTHEGTPSRAGSCSSATARPSTKSTANTRRRRPRRSNRGCEQILRTFKVD